MEEAATREHERMGLQITYEDSIFLITLLLLLSFCGMPIMNCIWVPLVLEPWLAVVSTKLIFTN